MFENKINTGNVLNAKVLILNQTYEPLSVCTVRKALILVFLGKAHILETNNKIVVSSASQQFPFPGVIRLNYYISRPFKKVILSRKNILRRDGFKCAYCGRSDLPLTIDHIIPKSRGGEDTWLNLISACLPCNNKKGDRTPEEANLKLKVTPYQPTHSMYLLSNLGRVNELWKPYLNNKE